jgi:drug/metabolite transporter, DME family
MRTGRKTDARGKPAPGQETASIGPAKSQVCPSTNDEADPISPSPWMGRLYCVGAAILWSTAGVFIKSLTSQDHGAWSAWQVAGARSLLAGITLVILSRSWGKTSNRIATQDAPVKTCWLPSRYELLLAMIYGPTLLTYVLAQTYTTTANAIFLQYTAPVYILLLSTWLLGERPKMGDLLTLPALLVGIALILSSGLHFRRGGFGNAMGLVSGVGYAMVIVLMRKWKDQGALRGVAWGNFLLAGVGIGLTVTVSGGFVCPDLVTSAEILWLGVAQIGFAYFLFQACLRSITAVEASLLALLEPVLCPLWAWLFVGDTPPTVSILGGGVILTALIAHTIWKARLESSATPCARRTTIAAPERRLSD